MLTDPLSENEDARLNELYAYQILDSPPEKEFDELAELAARVCECPVASITFVDKDRQWFKARVGDPTRETALEESFCAHTVIQDGIMVVEDAAHDPRFRNNSDVVGGLGIVFYAGVPIVSENGQNLGAVCVIDHKHRKLSQDQIQVLQLISAQVTRNLRLRLQNKVLSERSQQLKAGLLSDLRTHRDFFMESSVPQWVFDPNDFSILEVNKAAVALYGYTREEFLKLRVSDINTEAPEEKLRATFESVKAGKSFSFSATHRKKDGASLQVQISISEVSYNGRVFQVSSMLDISERLMLQKQLAEEQLDVQRKVTQAIIVSQEQEREYIGLELHDNVNQILASVKLYLELSQEHPEPKVLISTAKDYVMHAIDEIRRLSKKLVAPLIKEEGLVMAIEDLIFPIRAKGAFSIAFTHDGPVEDLPTTLKVAIFRIVQEQFTNILKYAAPSHVSIDLKVDNQVSLEIVDNGKGFDTSEKSKGIGLRNIRQRIAAFNGTFAIASKPGAGCRLLVSCSFVDVVEGFR
jgi:PAS domain S-box-containing protein